MLPTLPRVFCRRRPILHRDGRTGLIRFWIHLFSGTQILDLDGLVLRPRGTVQQRKRFAHLLRTQLALELQIAQCRVPRRSQRRRALRFKFYAADIPRTPGVFRRQGKTLKGLKPILGSWVIDVANGSSIPERSKNSQGDWQRMRLTPLGRSLLMLNASSTSSIQPARETMGLARGLCHRVLRAVPASSQAAARGY